MRAAQAEFVKSAASVDQSPPEPLPEVAFLGPSNVGKSTLVNCLLGRKALARVSRTPGRTQLLNFFRVDGRLYFVDLPGYGFAKAPRDVQDRFRRLVEEYLAGSRRLTLLVLLLDCRREPSARDGELLAWLCANRVPFAIVLTKADKMARGRLAEREREVRRALGAWAPPAILAFSAETGMGRQQLWGLIDAAVAPGAVTRPRAGSPSGAGPAESAMPQEAPGA